MTQQIHRRHVGDTRTVLPVTLQQPDSSGTLTAVNLTGLTVKFKMINAADDSTKVAISTTGVTVVTAASGTVNKDFSSGDVDTAGVYWGFFVAFNGSETDHFPVHQQGLKIIIDSDTKTGEEAYLAAISA